MPKDKTKTHDLIIKVVKQEFLAKGYEKVSMRDIGKKVGLTQAALYRHFKSKEDMFNSLVDPFMEIIFEKEKMHEEKAYKDFDETNSSYSMVNNNAVSMMKELMKDYHDELKLLICCSHGTKYETFIYDLVRMETKETLKAFDYIRSKGNKIKDITEDELHVLMSAYMQATIEPIVHDWSYEKSIKCLDLIEEFFIPAWKHIMGF